MYGPEVDNNFNTNKWVYLYYSPPTVKDVKLADGDDRHTDDPAQRPGDAAATNRTRRTSRVDQAWDPYVGYFQLSRFKFVDASGGTPAHLDLATEQEILRVPEQPRRVLPRRRRHRLRLAQQPVAGHR